MGQRKQKAVLLHFSGTTLLAALPTIALAAALPHCVFFPQT